MLLEIHQDNPNPRTVKQIVEVLKNDGVIIYPTDTVYGLSCDMYSQKATERICRIRNLNPVKANLSIVCSDIKQIASYAHQIDNNVFKSLKKHLPGPFTFILKANNKLPKLFKNKKKTLGVRVPDNKIVMAILEQLGNPMLTTSLKSDDEILEYFTDPSEIHDDFVKSVDLVVDGGIGSNIPSTVIDFTDNEALILRQGAGEFQG